jgi:YVTN family beta-propeller protein
MQRLLWKWPGKGILELALFSMLAAGLHQSARAGDGGATKVYFTEFRSGTVGVFDTRDNKAIKHIPVPKGAHGIAILPDGSRIFVSSDESSLISIIDAATDEVIGTIPTGKQPHGLVASRDGRFVYAAVFGDNQVLEIEPHVMKVIRTFDAPGPHNLALAPDGGTLYVASQKPGETGIAGIGLRTGKAESFIRTETVPRSINVSPDGRSLVSTQSDRNEVQFYSTNPLRQLRAVPVGGAPHHVLYTPDGKLVLVVNQITNDLTMIDAATMAVTGTIAVGKKPHWIAPTTDSKYAFVTDEASDQVSLVDLGEKEVEQTIAVGGGPRKIALQAGAAGGGEPAQGARVPVAAPREPGGKRVTVNIQGPPPRFVPDTVSVEAGSTIEWVNNGRGVHTVTGNDGAWDSGSLAPGERYARQFDHTGTFGYYCIPHHSMGMVGTIVVR